MQSRLVCNDGVPPPYVHGDDYQPSDSTRAAKNTIRNVEITVPSLTFGFLSVLIFRKIKFINN